jgi:hypothetical protein
MSRYGGEERGLCDVFFYFRQVVDGVGVRCCG